MTLNSESPTRAPAHLDHEAKRGPGRPGVNHQPTPRCQPSTDATVSTINRSQTNDTMLVGENFLYVFKAAASGRCAGSGRGTAPCRFAHGADPSPARTEPGTARSPAPSDV